MNKKRIRIERFLSFGAKPHRELFFSTSRHPKDSGENTSASSRREKKRTSAARKEDIEIANAFYD